MQRSVTCEEDVMTGTAPEIFRTQSLDTTRDSLYPVTPKHLYNICILLDQRRRRWDDVEQML